MFDFDTWNEIFDTIRKNKLRTFITAFNVAWGIFILILLIGFGNGFSTGVEWQFRDDAVNSMWIFPGQTSVPHRGLKSGRTIRMTNSDYSDVKEKIEGVEHITARYWVSGELTVRYKNRYSSFNVVSCHPGHKYLENTIVIQGRFLNEKDLKERRKVTSIGTAVVEVLFGNEPAIGKYIDVNGIKYKVVGVYEDIGSENEVKRIYIPINTAQIAYGGGNNIHQLMFTMGDAGVAESKAIEGNVRELLADKHRYAIDDDRAMRIFNGLENYSRVMALFGGIRGFLFIVGIFTLVAGVVGVSNIMLIVVKERTREIGIRKAIGATPRSVIALFLQEAMLITLFSGYIGLIAGIAFLEGGLLNSLMDSFGFPMDFFRHPEVNMKTAIGATVVLAVAGSLAGYFPARKAARIKPVEALKEE